jgi:hypothetical protein
MNVNLMNRKREHIYNSLLIYLICFPVHRIGRAATGGTAPAREPLSSEIIATGGSGG